MRCLWNCLQLFGYADASALSTDADGGDDHGLGIVDADLDVAAAAATGKNVSVFAVSSRRRLGPAAGNRHRRDVAVTIHYVVPLECYVTVSQRGTLTTWSHKASPSTVTFCQV